MLTPRPPPPACAPGALFTDLYQLTMLQGYFAEGMVDTAVFELFVRKLPTNRGFLVAAGLEQAVEYLEALRFTPEELDHLAGCGRFDKAFVERLAALRFTGDVHALPEGTVFFPDEPILRVTAPLPEAQIVETRIINLVHFETVIASKAARSVLAAPGKQLVDFGLRRAHGAEAGLLSARAAFLAGFSGSSNVEAERLFGIPAHGTMAHSYVQAHDGETAAFVAFARANPRNAVLLIDTYDTEAGAAKAVEAARALRAEGIPVRGVRIDSGDLGAHARAVREILDAGGLRDASIFASGGLDEFKLRDLAAAPIDGFGVGTRMNTSADAPYLDCAYKLQEYAGRARRKRSEGKATWPGRKQVYRRETPGAGFDGDLVTLEGDVQPGTPLLVPVMRAGRRIGALPTLDAIRRHAAGEQARLPAHLRALATQPAYPVAISPALRALAAACDRAV